MRKIFISSLLLAYSLSFSQNITSKKWKDLFSFNNVISFKNDDGKVIAATENGLFFYNTANGEITKLTKANGLHEVKISAFDYDPVNNIGLVGYTTGSLDVISGSNVLLSVDIPIAQGYNGDKNVNHISITGDKAIISANYGVSIFDLVGKEFGQSAFFVSGGTYEAAKEATIKDGIAYAATATGLKSHAIDVTFPVYSTWITNVVGDFLHIDSDESILSCSTVNTAYIENGGTFSPVTQSFANVHDVVISEQKIVVTDDSRIYSINSSGALVEAVTIGELCNTAGYVNGQIFGGTLVSGLKNTAGNSYKPDGPYNNTSYKLSILNDQIWVASGSQASFNDPVIRDLGYYHYDGAKWIYPQYFIDNPIDFNVMDVMANPSNPSEVFFTNYALTADKGIYKMQDNVFVKNYLTNSPDLAFNRPLGIGYDESNNLFVTVMPIKDNPLQAGYYHYNVSSDNFTLVPVANALGVARPVLKEGFILIPCPFQAAGGLAVKYYGSNPTQTGTLTKLITSANGLPISGTVAVAIDKNDDFWIGTRGGLRILSDGFNAVEEANPQTEAIVIEQNGIPEELFRDSTILDVEVDSGNQKWVAVEGGGVYYLSANGEQTYKHFTRENSPLPNNNVTDIQVDEKNGLVYFVTLDGIVAYQGDVSGVNSEFGNVLVYPNPVVYSNFKGVVTIRGLAEKTNIRIVDAAGNLVHQAVARGGFYEWNLMHQKGKRVASGVYFVLMTNEDGSDTATAKIAVVN